LGGRSKKFQREKRFGWAGDVEGSGWGPVLFLEEESGRS